MGSAAGVCREVDSIGIVTKLNRHARTHSTHLSSIKFVLPDLTVLGTQSTESYSGNLEISESGNLGSENLKA